MPDIQPTTLERLRDEMNLRLRAGHSPQWRFVEADQRFTWLFDHDRAVLLLDRRDEVIELRCHGPDSPLPGAEIPRHYHTPVYEGCRIIYTWRLGGPSFGQRVSKRFIAGILQDGLPTIRTVSHWSNGSISQSTARVRYDEAWGAYVVEVTAALHARRVTGALEYCNVLPAGIGDSRPGCERHPLTYWKHPAGFRKMLKNPLWFTSVGAQDMEGEKRIEPGGFIGFGPDDRMNPVIELVSSSPESGATTCDNLQDEHIMVLPASGRHAMATGWYRLDAHYRLFSIPKALAQEIERRAEWMRPGAMLAWKFQYPPTPELPADLTKVALPGSPFYGRSDWSQPVPWDQPYNGRLWTASPHPDAAIHYDRGVGRSSPGSIRLRAQGERIGFSPGSGHTLHTVEGRTYRFSMWIRTEGEVRAWIEALEMLFRPGDGKTHASPAVGPNSAWTYVEATFRARGEDAPFADTVLCADGQGQAWFTDMAFEEV